MDTGAPTVTPGGLPRHRGGDAQVARVDPRSPAEDDRTLDGVSQLTQVPRPGGGLDAALSAAESRRGSRPCLRAKERR